MNELFIKATRTKMRFPYKGFITVEDLWDLKVTELDKIFKTLNAQNKQSQEESLLTVVSNESKELSDKIEIIKYIVKVKQAEALAREQDAEKKVQNQKIMDIISRKEDAALEGKSIEELKAMLG